MAPSWSELRSLGYFTDTALARFDGAVEVRERYRVVRTPENPDHFWGNFLLYPEPPTEDSARPGHDASWLDDHAREFPGARFAHLAWDRPDGADASSLARDAFVRAGFGEELTVVLATDVVAPPSRRDPALRVARLEAEADWARASAIVVDAFMTCRSSPRSFYEGFVAREFARYRAMQDAGIAEWFAAFDGRDLVGTIGLVRMGTTGRFRLAGTAPSAARRGVCSTLLHEVSERARAEHGTTRFVVTADGLYTAPQVYARAGFEPVEQLRSLLRLP